MFAVVLRRIFLFSFLLSVAIQFIPYGRDHSNPPTRVEPQWDRPETRALAKQACFDCHSNETVWPWYSNVAPISWLVQRDVDEGRKSINFSEWHRPQKDADEVTKVIREGQMPQWYYIMLHPPAKLSVGERELLMLGLDDTVGGYELKTRRASE